MPESNIPPGGEIVLYDTEDGLTKIECRFVGETLWLSQALIAELFQVTIPTVNEHLKNLYEEGELQPDPTIRKFRIVRHEGKRSVSREIEHYNLDSILAVGYRVRSERGVQFRRWVAFTGSDRGIISESLSYGLKKSCFQGQYRCFQCQK